MNWQSVLNPETYKSILRERIWRSVEESKQEKDFSWPFDKTAADETQIYWPKNFEWSMASKWMGSLSHELKAHVNLKTSDIAQNWQGVTHLKATRKDKELNVIIDYSDYPELQEDALEVSDLYFKMQYKARGYDSDKVLPGGFVVNDQSIYKYISPLRKRSEKSKAESVYGRFNPDFGNDFRKKALTLLKKQNCFQYLGGSKKVRYSQYLTEASKAGICLDLPGKGELCFRLVDYLAIGCCVVTPRKTAELPEPLQEGKHIVYCKRDLSNLVDICEGLLANPAKRREIGENAANYFDNYLHREQLSSYYLSKILEKLS